MVFMATCIVIWLSPLVLGHGDANEEDALSLLFKTNNIELEDVPLKFEKELPKWLKGSLIRNGVGKFDQGKREMLHLFDGFAKLTSWKFNGQGNATFSTKFVKSKFYKESIASNDIAPFMNFMGVKPPYGFLDKMKLLINGGDNMDVNVYPYRKVEGSTDTNQMGYYALTDFWKMYEFNATNLETIELISPKIPGGGFEFASMMSTAHPLPEPGKPSTLLHLAQSKVFPWQDNKITLVRIHATDKREIVASIPVDQIPYMHSFSVTENYAIFFCNPVFMDFTKILKTFEALSSIVWDGSQPTMVKVVNLKTGEVTHLETETNLVLHHANAYEKDNRTIVVDLVPYANTDIVTAMTLENFRDPKKRNKLNIEAKLRRYYIDLKEKHIKPASFDYKSGIPEQFEFPRINDAYRGRPYCFLYGVAGKADNRTIAATAIVKKDVCNKSGDLAYINMDHYVNEAVFVPRPNSEAEDDGILLLPLLDGKDRKSYLYILDAKTMNVTNRAELPTIVPFTFHGSFFPDVY